MATEAQPGELLDRVQQLTAQVDELADARARELAQELVATVIAMYGDGLERIMEAIERLAGGRARRSSTSSRRTGRGQPAADPRPVSGLAARSA